VGFSGTIVSSVSMLKRVVEIWLLAFPPAAAISSTICPRRIARQIGKYNIPLQLQYLPSAAIPWQSAASRWASKLGYVFTKSFMDSSKSY